MTFAGEVITYLKQKPRVAVSYLASSVVTSCEALHRAFEAVQLLREIQRSNENLVPSATFMR